MNDASAIAFGSTTRRSPSPDEPGTAASADRSVMSTSSNLRRALEVLNEQLLDSRKAAQREEGEANAKFDPVAAARARAEGERQFRTSRAAESLIRRADLLIEDLRGPQGDQARRIALAQVDELQRDVAKLLELNTPPLVAVRGRCRRNS